MLFTCYFSFFLIMTFVFILYEMTKELTDDVHSLSSLILKKSCTNKKKKFTFKKCLKLQVDNWYVRLPLNFIVKKKDGFFFTPIVYLFKLHERIRTCKENNRKKIVRVIYNVSPEINSVRSRGCFFSVLFVCIKLLRINNITFQ